MCFIAIVCAEPGPCSLGLCHTSPRSNAVKAKTLVASLLLMASYGGGMGGGFGQAGSEKVGRGL